MKLSPELRPRPDEYKNRPDTELGSGFRQRAKWGVAMRESQCFDTDLNRRSDFTGTRMRISVKRSSSEAIVSAEDGYSDMMDFKSSNEWLVLCVNLLLVLLQLLTCGGALLLMFFCSFLGIALLNVDNKLLVEIGLLTRSVVFVSRLRGGGVDACEVEL